MLKKAGLILGLFIVAVPVFVLPSCAGTSETLWYNGDFDGYSGLINGVGSGYQSKVFDDFVVGGTGWVVNEVWANNLINKDIIYDINMVNQAYWEIRSGLSVGNSGSVVASGTGSVSASPTGNNLFGYLDEYTIKVSGLNVPLSPGTYWLAVMPATDYDVVVAYVSTTLGTNAIGSPSGNNQNNFLDWPVGGYIFASAQTILPNRDYSMGIGATAGKVVPEPASMLLFGIGGAGIALAKRLRKA